ncbi:MAG: MarR family transcriptional regulator [Alphaproteobacteria bacterium]|nr:MarR family transcriptional regulator [Alphaproteobacteria bacterium]
MNELLARKMVEPGSAAAWRRAAAQAAASSDENALELVELFFFAYRDFVGDADRLLGKYGFGRAHHRVLHFVNRRPGLTIAALLDILRITKQSLNRVLKQLLDAGFVEARAGVLLYTTAEGARLARDLAALQSARFLKVMDELPPVARGAASEFLFAMIDPEERERVRAHLACAKMAVEAP